MYARLVFPTNTPILKKLKDIAKVCVGDTNLEYVVPSSCEFFQLIPSGWKLEQMVFDGSFPTEYFLSAPCINPNKTKYVSLSAFVQNFTLNNAPGTTNILTAPDINSIQGSLFILGGSSVQNGVLQNASFVPKTFTKLGTTTNVQYLYKPRIDLGLNEVYISVTEQKIFIYSPSASPMFISSLEFPETQHTLRTGNIPNLLFGASNITLANINASTAYKHDYINNAVTETVGPVTSITVERQATLANWFSSTDGNFIGRSSDGGIGFQYFPQTQVPISGKHIFSPIMDIRVAIGEGTHNYSELTDVYFTTYPSSYMCFGDTIKIRGNEFVLFSIGTGTNRRTLAVKKG